MNLLIFTVYPLLLMLLLWRADYKKGSAVHEDSMGRKQMKATLGFFSICIILHHVAQKTASWDTLPLVSRCALLPFKNSGFLFVAYFFFASGFGLQKSASSKPDYLVGFLPRHFMPVLISFFATEILFLFVRRAKGDLAFPLNPYSWYVPAILILYLGFYLSCRFLKERACIGIFGYTLLWCVTCRLLIAETYWYNGVLAFPLGVFVAACESEMKGRIRAHYWPTFLCGGIVFCVLCFLSLDDMRLYQICKGFLSFAQTKELQTLLQMTASMSFCVFVTLIGMKLKPGSRLLDSLGAMTLETYLVHVLFVELFGERFFGSGEPLLYIRDPFLYLWAVILLSLPLAFLIRLLREKLTPLLLKSSWTAWLGTVFIRIAGVVLVLGILAAVYYSSVSHKTTKQSIAAVNAYREENICFTEVDGRSMAAYLAGEGSPVILLLSDTSDPAPSLTLRGLADCLSESCRVIVPDYFGHGFSDHTDKERTAEQIASELHELVNALCGESPVLLMTYGTAEICAETYIQNYPDQVRALIGFDPISPAIIREYYDNPDLTAEEIGYEAWKAAKREQLGERFMIASGFVRMELEVYRRAFQKQIMHSHFDVLSEEYILNTCSEEAVREQSCLPVDARMISDVSLPRDLPVLFMSSYRSNLGKNPAPKLLLQEALTNEEKQRVAEVLGDSYYIITNPKLLAEEVIEFMSSMSS